MNPKNLFSSNKFKFILTGTRFKDNEFDLTVTGINVPGIQLGTVPLNTPIRTIDRPGDSITFSDITIEFLITEDLEEWITLYNWMNDLRSFTEMVFDNSIVSEGKLILLTNKSNPNLILIFQDMFPIDISDLDLTLNTTDGEPVRGTANFKFSDMIVTTTL